MPPGLNLNDLHSKYKQVLDENKVLKKEIQSH